jgi:hypothetical protein
MQALYKLIFAFLVLKARKDGLRARATPSGGQSKPEFPRNGALPTEALLHVP